LLLCSFLYIALGDGDYHVPTTHAPTTRAPTTHAPTTHSPTTPRHGHPTRPRPPVFPPWEPRYTAYEKQNINTTKLLYSGLLYPTAKNIVNAGVYPPGVFADNAAGRIVPVGNFDDQEGSFEYFYGLAAAVDIVSIDFVKIIARDNIVAFQANLLINQSSVSTQGLQNLTQEGFITFNNDSLIVLYDLVILRLGQASPVPPAADPFVIDNICVVAGNYCTGVLQQYTSYAECVTYLSNINFGSFDNLSSNTTCCRTLHSALVPLRPAIHCPHIGPTGGNACIDTPYAEFYQQNF